MIRFQFIDLIDGNRPPRNSRTVPGAAAECAERGTLDRHPACPANMIRAPSAGMETIPSGDCFVVEL